MKNNQLTYQSDFDKIIQLIDEAKSRAFGRVNNELVLLYFNVGSIVSEKVMNGHWGESIVSKLGVFIQQKHPTLSSFNRRGLYRMKQFFETYSIHSNCFKLWTELHQLKVSLTATLLTDEEHQRLFQSFLSSLLLQIAWSNNLEILSGAKQDEQ